MRLQKVVQHLMESCTGCDRECTNSLCSRPVWLAAKIFPDLCAIETWYLRNVGEIPPPAPDVRRDIATNSRRTILVACRSYLKNVSRAQEAGLLDAQELVRLLPPAIHYLGYIYEPMEALTQSRRFDEPT